jgi:hypothetical protein
MVLDWMALSIVALDSLAFDHWALWLQTSIDDPALQPKDRFRFGGLKDRWTSSP